MSMLVDCSNCRTPLRLPPGATSIRCALCQAVTQVADPRGFQPPHPHSTPSHHYPPPSPAAAAAPSPYNHAPMGQPPSVHGRKRAVICGISYKYSRHELKGCVNDARCMKYLLINRFKFPESSIITLTGLDGINGRTIGLGRVYGKEQVVVRLFPSAAVMTIKHLLIQLLYPRSLQLVQ